jgi:nucleotide-binding universal stress UspA family protein
MKVLVPVDYSEHSRAVLNYALKFAERLDAEVTAAHVWETKPNVPANFKVKTPDGRSMTAGELIREEALGAMNQFLKSMNLSEGSRVSSCILSGAAADAIIKKAEQGGYDLIVMGTQSRTGIGRFVLGSVAERVIKTTTIPVLAVPLSKVT